MNHKLHVTTLLPVLVFVETTGLIYAADSISARLAITKYLFIIYIHNVLAIIWLRYHVSCFSGSLKHFTYL